MTISKALHSFMQIQVFIWYHFPSAWRPSFNISYAEELLAINSFSFCVIEKVFFSPPPSPVHLGSHKSVLCICESVFICRYVHLCYILDFICKWYHICLFLYDLLHLFSRSIHAAANASHFRYPFICRWTLKLFPSLCCCKQCCCEHRGYASKYFLQILI